MPARGGSDLIGVKGKIAVTLLLSIGLIAGWVVGVAMGLIAGGFFGTPTDPSEGAELKTFIVIPFHWGFAVFDSERNRLDVIEVNQGDIVQLVVMPASALSHGLHEQFEEIMIESGIGDLAPGNETAQALAEAEAMGLMTHTLSIPEYGVRVEVTGNTNDPAEAHQVVQFVADKKGSFDFLCQIFCGAGHPWMTLSGGLVVS